MTVVSNTSPISSLATVGRLELLQQIYGLIVIPTAVYNELTAEGAGEVIATAVKTSTWIETRAVTKLTIVASLMDKINEGEAEAIALAIELNAEELLMDERLGRREAIRLGVSITGVLGVLSIAKGRGIISAVKPAIDELRYRADFRIGQKLYNEVLEAAGE